MNFFQIGVCGVKCHDLLAQIAEQRGALDGALDDEQQLLVVPGFLQVLVEADLINGLDGALFVGVSGEQDAGRFGLELFGFREQLQAVHFGHEIVADNDVDRIGFQELGGFFRFGEAEDVVLGLQAQEGADTGDDHIFVIDDHDCRLCVRGHCGYAP